MDRSEFDSPWDRDDDPLCVHLRLWLAGNASLTNRSGSMRDSHDFASHNFASHNSASKARFAKRRRKILTIDVHGNS